MTHFLTASLRTALLAPLALFACLGLAQSALGASPAQEAERVVVLGFDGGDARTVAAMMEAGELPNLAALRASGTFGPLMTTSPAESPVSWSSLNTGQNPAKTGIPGFVVRDLSGSSGLPLPGIGFYESDSSVPIEELDAPIPTLPAAQLGGGLALVVLLLFFVVLKFLLRLKLVPSAAISILLAVLGYFAGSTYRGYLPDGLPVVKNTLEATPFWEIAAAAGVKSVVLDAAQAWDREPVPGAKVLAGLGVPDARGQYNGFTIYTTDELWFAYEPTRESETPSAGNKLRVDWSGERIEAKLYGPSDFVSAERLRAELEVVKDRSADPKTPYKKLQSLGDRQKEIEAELERLDDAPLSVPLVLERKGEGLELTIDDMTQQLAVGEWSDWFSPTFVLNPLIKVHALTRAKVISLDDPHLTLYVDTLQIDPAKPPFWQPISQPAEFSKELSSRTGPFETVGWACMTLPYKDTEVDPVSFLQDIEFTFKWRETMTMDRLKQGDWRLFMSCFSTPDRVQHMMYKFYDQEHPLYDAEAASQRMTFFGEEIELRDAIPAIYRQVDRLIGQVRAELAPEDVLILCADHGFQSFRRQVHLNNWLQQEGFLAVQPRLSPGRSKLVTSYVDWSKTRAFSIGLGTVYVNMKGREYKGIVEPADVPALLAEIKARFLESEDPDTGAKIGRVADPTSEIHEGPFLDREADLMLGFDAGYRVSWATTGGGIDVVKDEGSGEWVVGPAVVDNDKTWSGDHVSVDPSLVQGLFFCSVPLELPADGLDLRHVAPTALSMLGIDLSSTDCDLPPLSPAR